MGLDCIHCGRRRILSSLVALTLVIDYLSGAQRGQRQVMELSGTVTFGRHPDNMVSFDARADIDASARHAELIGEGSQYKILDVGSSNGTWIAGERIQEHGVEIGAALEVEFGKGGPRLKIWLGEDEAQAPPPIRRASGWRRFLPW